MAGCWTSNLVDWSWRLHIFWCIREDQGVTGTVLIKKKTSTCRIRLKGTWFFPQCAITVPKYTSTRVHCDLLTKPNKVDQQASWSTSPLAGESLPISGLGALVDNTEWQHCGNWNGYSVFADETKGFSWESREKITSVGLVVVGYRFCQLWQVRKDFNKCDFTKEEVVCWLCKSTYAWGDYRISLFLMQFMSRLF